MSRWKYKTELVTVDENSVTVRGLTAGERLHMSDVQKKGKALADTDQATIVPGDSAVNFSRQVAKCGVINPPLTDQDLAEMPGQLLDAVVAKVLELSGVDADEKAEKKDDAATLN